MVDFRDLHIFYFLNYIPYFYLSTEKAIDIKNAMI